MTEPYGGRMYAWSVRIGTGSGPEGLAADPARVVERVVRELAAAGPASGATAEVRTMYRRPNSSGLADAYRAGDIIAHAHLDESGIVRWDPEPAEWMPPATGMWRGGQ